MSGKPINSYIVNVNPYIFFKIRLYYFYRVSQKKVAIRKEYSVYIAEMNNDKLQYNL